LFKYIHGQALRLAKAADGHAQIQGDGAKLTQLMNMLDTFPKMFNIVIA